MYILIGAGGHAKVIIDTLLLLKKPIKGFLDDNFLEKSSLGFPVLGGIDKIPSLIENNTELKFIIAIGSNAGRKKIAKQLEKYPIVYGNAVHPTAVISNNASIGEGSVVMANSVINSNVNVGKHCIVNTSSVIEHDCIITDYVHVSPGALIAGNVRVGEESHIGLGARVIQGLTIGSNSIIGAGSVVIDNVKSNVKIVGVPAKKILKD